jgi:hypothetical protein
MSDLEMEVLIGLFVEEKQKQGNGLEFIHQMLTSIVDITIEEYEEMEGK